MLAAPAVMARPPLLAQKRDSIESLFLRPIPLFENEGLPSSPPQPILLLITFRLPLLPKAPALAPAARAGPGGLEGELAGPDPPGPGDAGVQEMPEVASLALPRPGCIGWVVV